MRIPFPVTHGDMVTNLSAVLQSATDDQLSEGMLWYPSAFDTVADMAARHDVTHSVAAGVVAALSPRTFWSVNVAAADYMLATNGEHYESTLWANHNRALNVMRGADPLTAWSDRAPKIRSFYRNLCGDTSAVTVDVWAALAALTAQNDPARVLPRVGAYEAVSGAYRALAGTVGVDPCTAQAQVWVTIRHAAYAERALVNFGGGDND